MRPESHPAIEDQVGDAVGDDPRLAAPGAGEDENRPLDRGHGRALLIVEPGENGRRQGQEGAPYSTVTDLARLRGWSTSRPARSATW